MEKNSSFGYGLKVVVLEYWMPTLLFVVPFLVFAICNSVEGTIYEFWRWGFYAKFIMFFYGILAPLFGLFAIYGNKVIDDSAVKLIKRIIKTDEYIGFKLDEVFFAHYGRVAVVAMFALIFIKTTTSNIDVSNEWLLVTIAAGVLLIGAFMYLLSLSKIIIKINYFLNNNNRRSTKSALFFTALLTLVVLFDGYAIRFLIANQ